MKSCHNPPALIGGKRCYGIYLRVGLNLFCGEALHENKICNVSKFHGHKLVNAVVLLFDLRIDLIKCCVATLHTNEISSTVEIRRR